MAIKSFALFQWVLSLLLRGLLIVLEAGVEEEEDEKGGGQSGSLAMLRSGDCLSSAVHIPASQYASPSVTSVPLPG